MGSEIMSANSGKFYTSNDTIVTPFDSYSDLRKAFQATRNDCNDQSIFRGVNSGNFGTALESITGIPQVTNFTISIPYLTQILIPPDTDYNFVLTAIVIIVKANADVEEKFGLNKVIAIDGYKDGIKIFDQQYKNLTQLASFGNGLNIGVNTVKVNGVLLNLYSTVIDFAGDCGGLVFRNDDYFRVRSLDVTDPQNPIESPIDMTVATFGFRGYLIEC